MKSSRRFLLATIAVAAVATTAWPPVYLEAINEVYPAGPDATHAYVYSPAQIRHLKDTNRVPAIVCVPESIDFVVTTNIVPHGDELKKQLRDFPDTIIITSSNPEKTIVLRRPDGKVVTNILAQLMEKYAQETPEATERIKACLENYLTKLAGPKQAPEKRIPVRPNKGIIVAQHDIKKIFA